MEQDLNYDFKIKPLNGLKKSGEKTRKNNSHKTGDVSPRFSSKKEGVQIAYGKPVS
ncbi:hypothetical protein JCM17380_39180 [Desulfosporosinus burensis]